MTAITEQLKAEADAIKALTAKEKLTDGDVAALKAHTAAAKSLKAKARLESLDTTGPNMNRSDAMSDSKTLGARFVEAVGEQLKAAKGRSFTVSAPNLTVKAATTLGDSPLMPLATTVDTDIVSSLRRPTILSRFGQGTVDGMALTFFTEGDWSGAAPVKEGASKPSATPSWTQTTVPVTKVAAYVEVSDEMLSDLAFVQSEIDDHLTYDLGIAEENQTINGTGTAPQMTGLLKAGIQTLKATKDVNGVETLLKAQTAIQNATGLAADTIVLNPADFETIRLSKDSNGQYFGGGFFGGAYGQRTQPDTTLWGIPVVTTPALAAGTALVGAFRTGATLYTRGGVDVEATNSHGTNFTSDITTIRAEIRAALAVRKPSAFVAVTLAQPSA